MILDDNEIRNIYLVFTEPVFVKSYAIRIDGQTFVTSRGKMLRKKKNHATSALRMCLEPVLCGRILRKLNIQGRPLSECYRHPEYRNAWDNYRKYLEDNNLLQIIEVRPS